MSVHLLLVASLIDSPPLFESAINCYTTISRLRAATRAEIKALLLQDDTTPTPDDMENLLSLASYYNIYIHARVNLVSKMMWQEMKADHCELYYLTEYFLWIFPLTNTWIMPWTTTWIITIFFLWVVSKSTPWIIPRLFPRIIPWFPLGIIQLYPLGVIPGFLLGITPVFPQGITPTYPLWIITLFPPWITTRFPQGITTLFPQEIITRYFQWIHDPLQTVW